MKKYILYHTQFYRLASKASAGARKQLQLLFPVCLLVILSINQAYAQTITLSGRVTNMTGPPLPGVTIVVKGTSMGTSTNSEGYYSLKNTPEDAVLIFSFIGFKSRKIPLNGRTQINVQLQEDVTTLSEVTVNAGYYTVKDQERTGSIARVRAKELENQPVSNALSSVQGRMAGVNITQSSGTPGGGYDIQIRGTNSLRRSGNYPLYIIDGVPATLQTPTSLGGIILPHGEIDPLNAINPNDIESIEILKDADATAIYGSRGANGVILVTTKRGKADSKTVFSINSSYGVSRIANKMEMMNTQQYLEMRRQAYVNDGITDYPPNAYDINGTWDETRYTDWQEELIGRKATNSMLQFSLSGGSKESSYIISGSHNEQTTVFSDDFKYKTDNISGSFSHHSTDNRFLLNVSGLFSNQSNNLIQSEITSEAIRLAPNAPALYHEDGSLNWENNTFTNPLAAYESTYSYKSKTFNTNLNTQYELLPSVYLKLNGGISYTAFEELMLRPNTMYNPAFGLTPDLSQAFKNQNQQFSWIVEPQLNYRHTFNNHEIDMLIGGTLQQTQRTALNVMGYGFESNALITNLAAAANVIVSGDDKVEYRYAAVFGRINYQFKERYIVNLTGRRDGSSRFGPNQRFASFGAVGGAWLFSRENFFASSQWLSFGKLRASYGISGSDLIGDYQYLDTYTVSNTLYGGNTSLYPSRLNNPYFSWEKTTKLEAALELGFLNDRIQFSAAWYRNRSGNQLVGIPLPATTGFSNIQANLPAKVENKGLELEFSATPVQSNQFSWNSSINISFPKNKLISFPGLEGSTYANQYVVGYPTSIIKVYNYEGIDAETGLYRFTDYNNDGNITSPDDNQVIENTAVKYFGGWSNQLSYKQCEFSLLFQFVKQRQQNYISLMPRPGSIYNQPVEVLNVWSQDNPDGQYMPYSSGTNSQINQLHSYYSSSTAAISDASFVRLKNVQLGYTLQFNNYLQNARFYVQGQNLLTLTNYFGLDPEFSLTGFLPPLKTWAFGIQLNF